MKYLKSLKLFLEEFEISDTDYPDVAAKKKDLNLLLSHINDYNGGVSAIDNIFLNQSKGKSSADVTKMTDKIITKNGNRNTFLSQYVSASRMKMNIEKAKEKLKVVYDKIKTTQASLLIADDDDKKSKLKSDIIDDNDKIRKIELEIKELKKEISEKEKELKQKMSDKRKELEEKIKNI